MSSSEPTVAQQIRRLLMQPGMLLLFLFVGLSWGAVAYWGNDGLLTARNAIEDTTQLTPARVVPAETEASPAPDRHFATLVAATPAASSATAPADGQIVGNTPASGRFSDFFAATPPP